MRVVCLIQARRNSARLPNKVMEKIGDKTMLQHVVERCQAIRERFPVTVISPPEDFDLYPAAIQPDCPPDDLLKRHLIAAQWTGADAVMRVTSDCPFMDPQVARDVLSAFEGGHYDYVANDLVKTYPDGLGVEIIKTEALAYAEKHTPPDDVRRQHCTPYIIEHLRGRPSSSRGNPQGNQLFEGLNIRSPISGLAEIKLSVDTHDDLALARAIHAVGPRSTALVDTLVAYRKVLDAEMRVKYGEAIHGKAQAGT